MPICAVAAIATAPSALPPLIAPVRRSVSIGRAPKITFAAGSTSHAKIMPASVSATVCAIVPAGVTGLDAPIWPKVFACSGIPWRTAAAATSQDSGSKRSGGTGMLQFSDRNGLASKASREPAIA